MNDMKKSEFSDLKFLIPNLKKIIEINPPYENIKGEFAKCIDKFTAKLVQMEENINIKLH